MGLPSSSLEGGIDHVLGDADREPVVARAVGAFDKHTGHGLGPAIEDTDLVVDQLEVRDGALIDAQVLPEGAVQRIDRTIPLGNVVDALAADGHLHHGLRHRHLLAARIVTPFDGGVETLDLKIGRHRTQPTPGQKLERGIRALVGIASGLAPLQFRKEAVDARIGAVEQDSEAIELGDKIRPARLVGDKNSALVADDIGRDVLIGSRVFRQRGRVDTGLGREGARTDIRRLPFGTRFSISSKRRDSWVSPAERGFTDADLEAVGVAGLEHQGRDQRHKVGVAAALAVPVEGAAGCAGPAAVHRKGIGDRQIGVVMGMNAE